MQIFFVITDRRSQIGGTGTTPLLYETHCLLAPSEPGGSADGGGGVRAGRPRHPPGARRARRQPLVGVDAVRGRPARRLRRAHLRVAERAGCKLLL